jgi:hypothetical protein
LTSTFVASDASATPQGGGKPVPSTPYTEPAPPPVPRRGTIDPSSTPTARSAETPLRSSSDDVRRRRSGKRATSDPLPVYGVRCTVYGFMSREGVAPSPPASDAGMRLLHHRDRNRTPYSVHRTGPVYGVRCTGYGLSGTPDLHQAYACFRNRWGAASPCPWDSAAERSRTSNTPRLRRRRLPDCATAANVWCPVRELHPHRLDVSETSCCWKNRT